MYEQNETTVSSPEMVDAEIPTETPSAEETTTAGPTNIGGAEATEMGADEAIPSDPAQSPDPAPQALDTDQKTDSELECIRRELSLLRAQLDGQARAMQKIGIEYAEFCDLYPDKSPEDFPDEVWDSVRQGIPLSAAFALAERKKQRLKEKAQLLNEENKRRSSGAVERAASGYFTPSEVRAMSQAEVRANYQNILLSMANWK